MLQALGVFRIALLSNNPDKARQLRRFGVTVAATVPTGLHLSPDECPLPGDEGREGRPHDRRSAVSRLK
jgi:GTP cyclohydrolase II